MAGVFEHCGRITCRRLVGRYPRNVGVPRMRSNASLSGGVGTTISCGATRSTSYGNKPDKIATRQIVGGRRAHQMCEVYPIVKTKISLP